MNHPSITWVDNLSDLFSSFSSQLSRHSQIYILIDEQVSQIWLNDILEQCIELNKANVIEIPCGEDGKDWDILAHVIEQLAEDAADRNTLLINIGGGATTDLGGFAATIYKRGIDFFHVPTTLMAMVDASLGGKNGINFKGVKNVIGTFEPPNELIICPVFLSSLPDDELLSGMAEMLKHGLIQDAALWEALIDLDEISAETLTPFIQRNIQIKLTIVERDPFESGDRKLLNFGHTVGHAIESYLLQNNIQHTHGHCVAWGMIFSCLLAQSDKILNKDSAQEIIENLLDLYPIPTSLPSWEDIQKYLVHDKKNQDGKLQFTLIKEIGTGLIQHSKTIDEIQPIWEIFKDLI